MIRSLPPSYSWLAAALLPLFLPLAALAQQTVARLDSTAIVALYNSAGGDNWTCDHRWLTGQVKYWRGIGISRDQRITEINLEDCDLDGTIPREIRFLTELRRIRLKGNNLQSPIPDELWQLQNLQLLDLSENVLTGQLPDSLGVPRSTLWLGHNEFEGALPAYVYAQHIDLSHNLFSGLVPDFYVDGDLNYVNISHNSLTVWPDSAYAENADWWNSGNHLIASHNQFSGSLPDLITGNAFWGVLDLSHNSFSGDIPNGFRADILDLSHNKFSGTIPEYLIIGVIGTQGVNLEHNQLTGSIPPISNPYLYWLDFSDNAFTEIDPQPRLRSLEWLDLSNNAFTEFDSDLFELASRSLTTLDLSDNIISSVPDGLSDLWVLERLWLGGNQFSGEIPIELSLLLELELLDISGNSFAGSIPSWIGEFHDLETLNLSHNQFDGSIPDMFGRLNALDSLDLSYNLLTGELPPSLIGLTGLKRLDLSGNDLLGSLAGFANNPGLTAIDVSGNSFSEGLFAVDSTMYPELKLLDLSHNDFAGSLDQVIAGPTKLTVLRVSENEFEGDVPEALAESKDLVTIRLNENDFSSLPDLTALSSLDTLDVGGNALTFEHLEANRPFTSSASFTFAPQDTIAIGLKRTDTQVKLRAGTLGTNNAYRWYRNGTLMAGEVSEELLIPISAPVADYHAEVTNSWFPGLTLISHPIASDAMPVGNWELEQTPLSFELFPSYPNPSRSEIRIPFELEKTVDTRISVTDLLGREVQTLIDNTMVSGRHEIQMNVRGLAPGLYFIHAQLGDYRQSRQFIVMQ